MKEVEGVIDGVADVYVEAGGGEQAEVEVAGGEVVAAAVGAHVAEAVLFVDVDVDL